MEISSSDVMGPVGEDGCDRLTGLQMSVELEARPVDETVWRLLHKEKLPTYSSGGMVLVSRHTNSIS